MSDLVNPSRGLFFASILYNEELLDIEKIKQMWIDRFGRSVEFHHPFFPMKCYYSRQMGPENKLRRILMASLIADERDLLVGHKIWADQLEKEMKGEDTIRPLNLDIGLLTLENMVLATGKSFSHRLYLGRGVYADLNLQFENKTMKPLSWTYPDYSHADFIQFFNWLRGFLHRKNSEKILD